MISHSEQETKKFGEKIGKKLESGDVVALYGELGSGKTVLVKGITTGIGCKDRVSSPSFIFVHEYKCEIPVYHIDLYRTANLKDLFFIGIQELFANDRICLVEWAEKAQRFLPSQHIAIKIKVLGKDTREISTSNASFGN